MSKKADRPRIAIVCSGHGYGHVTRQLAIASEMAARRAAPVVFSTMPPLMAARLAPGVGVRHWEADVGFVQSDGLSEDVTATRARLEAVCSDERVEGLAAVLGAFDLVVADVAAPALEAARRVGRRAVAVGNFDWAWVYRHYDGLEVWAERFAQWQAPHRALSLWPGPGMRGFAATSAAGLVALRAAAPAELPGRSVLVSFGRWGFEDLADVLPRVEGVTWVTDDEDTLARRGDAFWPEGVPYPALVAGADAVLTKPGYGIVAEALQTGTRLAWFPRGRFPEAPFLEEVLVGRGDPVVDVGDGSRRALRAGIEAAVLAALAAPAPAPGPGSAAGDAAEWVLAQLADGSGGKSP